MDFRKLLLEERRRARQSKSKTKAKDAAPEGDSPTSAVQDESPAVFVDSASVSATTWAEQPLTLWTKRSRLDIEPFRETPVPTVYYVPDWISVDEEAAILERIYSADSKVWVSLRGRRLQMWGGQVVSPFHPESLPRWLLQISQALVDAGIFAPDRAPNHVLINEYGVGEGILPHEDGPSYFPLVAIISVANSSRVTFEPHRKFQDDTQTAEPERVEQYRFTLDRRSLLLFTDQAYTHYLHSIDNVVDGTRLSLTVRHVDLH